MKTEIHNYHFLDLSAYGTCSFVLYVYKTHIEVFVQREHILTYPNNVTASLHPVSLLL